MKLQLKNVKSEIVSLIIKEFKNNKTLLKDLVSCWNEHCETLNNVLGSVGAVILLDNPCGVCESYTEVSFYSFKLGYRIILDGDAFLEVESLADLADLLVSYNDEARKLEAKLPKIR